MSATEYRINLAAYKDAINIYDSLREKVVVQSRLVLRLSKKLIHIYHRDLMEEGHDVDVKRQEVRDEFCTLRSIGNDTPYHEDLIREGASAEAAQEYVEAMVYADFCEGRNPQSAEDLDVSVRDYLLGVCDVGGELVRRATNAVLAGKAQEARRCYVFGEDIYGQLLDFDLRNGHLRKKVDSFKYAVQKMQAILYDMKLKGEGHEIYG
ncbi:MAG: translin family protein [Nanoarchaeota archaeon]